MKDKDPGGVARERALSRSFRDSILEASEDELKEALRQAGQDFKELVKRGRAATNRALAQARGSGSGGPASAVRGLSADQLFQMVYRQLHSAARSQMRDERASHTLSATALVHEAYLKLREIPWGGKQQFYKEAVKGMRQLLIDHARRRNAQKRGGAEARRAALELTTLPDLRSSEQSAGFLILDEAILRLKKVKLLAGEVVDLRYFAGLSVKETAETLNVSMAKVKSEWIFAKAWLKEAIESDRV